MPKKINLLGKRFGKLLVINELPSKNGKTYWQCQCDCGKIKDVQTCHLLDQTTKSCGSCKYDRKFFFCLNCGEKLKEHQKKYCSNKCQKEYQQKEWEEKWFAGEDSGNCNGEWPSIKHRVRTYLFKKYNNKCSRCGWSEINPYTGKIPLEVEHIDGNAENTTPENVTLLCPNCHSLTPTYKGANIGKGRPKTWIPKTDLDISV